MDVIAFKKLADKVFFCHAERGAGMDGKDYRIYLRQQIDGQTGHALLVVEAGRVDQINIVLADHGGIIEYGFPQRAGHGLTVRGQLCNGVSEAGKRNLFRGAVAVEENRPAVLAVGDAADGGGGGGGVCGKTAFPAERSGACFFRA